LPKYVGEPERENNPNSSPIKSHKWDEEEVEFKSSYQSHFNEKPHEIMTNSRM
jgi:hypothetical protein